MRKLRLTEALRPSRRQITDEFSRMYQRMTDPAERERYRILRERKKMRESQVQDYGL